jgi:hypothetical protein
VATNPAISAFIEGNRISAFSVLGNTGQPTPSDLVYLVDAFIGEDRGGGIIE